MSLRHFVRFNAAGALGIGVQLGLLWMLVHLVGLAPVTATALAVTGAVVHNFLWHWRWTWADRAMPWAHAPAAFARFALANGAVSLGGNVVIMAVLVHGAGVAPIAANLAAIGACGVVNYILADKVVFVRNVEVQVKPGSAEESGSAAESVKCGRLGEVLVDR